jgi:hypothetical protein
MRKIVLLMHISLGGKPLFRDTPMNLRLLSSKAFASGVVGLHYEVAR